MLDWELAHAGDPAEDIGWLCAPAWRFGGRGRSAASARSTSSSSATPRRAATVIDPVRVRWWQVYATVKWAVICALQASAHLSGATRSVELAAIGRRVCESEWDLCTLLGLAPAVRPRWLSRARRWHGTCPLGRAVRSADGRRAGRGGAGVPRGRRDGGERPWGAVQSRVARNALLTVERELRLGPAMAGAHADRLAALGFDDDRQLAGALRSGTLTGRGARWARRWPPPAADQLLVANPAYLDGAST